MSRCTYNEGIKIMDTVSGGIQEIQRSVHKNYNEMRLENSSIQGKIEAVIEDIEKACKELHTAIDNCRLRK